MKSKRPIKSIVLTSIAIIVIMLFVTVSFAADTAKVSVETARLRKEASEDSTILELISLGEEVEILGQSGNWYLVEYKGITGYLRNDLIQVDGETQSNGSETATSGETVDTSATAQNNTQTGNEAGTTSENNPQAENANNLTGTENTESTEPQNTTGEQANGDTTTTGTTDTTENEEDLTGKYQFTQDVEIKITPLINSLTVSSVKSGDTIEIQDKVNDWVLVSNENIQGWARFNILSKVEETDQNQVLTTENIAQTTPETQEQPETQEPQTKTMYVNSQTVNVRSAASQEASVVTQLSINTQVTVISEQNGWAEVTFNGGNGYIASNLLSETISQTSRGSSTPRTGITDTTDKQTDNSSTNNNQESNDSSSNVSTSSKGADVLAYAMQFVGYPYVYGGSSTSGFDCSGFTQYVYKNFGVTLNRTAAAQSSNGTAVSRSNLQPGDLVMFGSPINHVGIYAGGGRIVHAANPSRGVTTDTINSGYYNTNYVCARRIF